MRYTLVRQHTIVECIDSGSVDLKFKAYGVELQERESVVLFRFGNSLGDMGRTNHPLSDQSNGLSPFFLSVVPFCPYMFSHLCTALL